MPSSSYRDRDYSFGQQILSLRTASNLTQTGLAELLGISRQAVVGWESGASYPSPQHLKHLIELYLQQNAFHRGQEAEEIRALWTNSGVRVSLDETWLAGLLSKPSPASAFPSLYRAPASHAEISPPSRLVDWGDAPELATFYGRAAELALLADWIVKEHCRVVSILGMGGIGKSALAVTLMHQIAGEFDAVIWRSLSDAPSPDSLRDELARLLTPEPPTMPLATHEQQLNLLFESLRTRRVLMVIDNFESVMEEAEGSGRIKPGLEGYTRFLRRAAETKHGSCVLLTSREKPHVLAPLEGSRTPVRSLHLGQLDKEACEALLQETELIGSPAERERLIESYGGNPLALKIVAPTIADLFGGEIDAFLEEGETIFGSVRYLLQEQFARLSALEESIMLWLAVLREPVTVQELSAVLLNPPPRARILEALDTLRGRSLIEHGRSRGTFTLHSVVLEYATTRLVEAAVLEIEHGQLNRLLDHRLLLASVKEYVWQSQARLIVAPILAQLRKIYPEPDTLENRLRGLFEPLRARSEEAQGYAPANLLTLLRALRGDLSGLDLHALSLRQVNLRGVDMHDTSLEGAILRDTVFTEASDTIWSMAFSKKGTYWAGGDRRGQVQVWLYTERRWQLAWRAHYSLVSAVVFSPDEQRVATGSWDGVIKIWDVSNGALLWTSPSIDAIMALAFSPDGRALASGGTDGKVRIWNMPDGALLQALNEHIGPLFCLAWSPDGTILASAGHDGQIRLWEMAHNDAELLKPTPRARLAAHTGPVRGLAFSPDGLTLASASWDRTVRFWDAQTGTQQESIPLQAHIEGLVWSQNGRYVASGELDRAFWVWDIQQHKQRTAFYGPLLPVRALAFSPDSSTLDTACEDGSMQVWDMTTGQCIHKWQGFAQSVNEVAWSPDGSRIASAGNEKVVTVWDIAKRAPLYVLRGHKAIIWGVAWSPDGRWLASGGEGNTIRIWDAVRGVSECVLTETELADAQNFALAWSPDGKRLAVATHRYGVLIYDMRTQTLQRVGRSDGPPRTRRVEWSPDGENLAASSEGGLIHIWNGEDYSLRATLDGHRGMVVSLAWSAAGTRLASGSWGHGGHQLLIWDTRKWKRIRALDDPNELVSGVAWSTDGQRLISAGSDGILRWWNVQNGECILSRHGHKGPVQSLRASPDSRLLASSGDDGAIQIWRIDSGEHVVTLRRDRPYERLDITRIKGLTDAQKLTLKLIGAIERD